MTESTFRIKKSRDNSKQELIGGTLDSVHQQVLSKLKEDNLDHTDMNEEIKKLESLLNNTSNSLELSLIYKQIQNLKLKLIKNNNLEDYYLKNSDIFLKDDKGFEKMFELYLHSLLVTYITKEENDKLAQLRGKVLTKDKYNEVGIILKKVSPKIHPKYFSKLGDAVNTVELPAPPKILTEVSNIAVNANTLVKLIS